MSLVDERCVVPLPRATGKLDEAQAAALLAEVPGFRIEGGMLRRTFEFATFLAGIAFVQRVAELAEAENHHPDIDVRYKVELALVTHDVGGLSRNDFIVAAKATRLA
ncbi:MAG: 4a-hydroxytetrahydrobiopterin dehydratase [Myxococcales bacterium]|nr:4a-hydroxytetrahydrobiopterin dehydratase [Myxococcales bacterium]